MKIHHGFTLLELLVVVAIIGILLALILPVLGRGRAASQGTVCVAQLREWGQATKVYVADHEGLLPPDGSPNGTSTNGGWYVDLPEAVKMPTYHEMAWRTNAAIEPGRTWWICPANPRRSNGENLFHYCLNKNINSSGTGNQVMMDWIPDLTTTVWMFDNGKLAAVAQQGNVHTNLHRKGANFVFLDGHAERLPSKEFWNSKTGKARTDNPRIRWVP